MDVNEALHFYACYENIIYNITYTNYKYTNINPTSITYFDTVTLCAPKTDTITQDMNFKFLGLYNVFKRYYYKRFWYGA